MDDVSKSAGTDLRSNGDLGFWGRLLNIFTNPVKTFEAIDIKPTWLVPMILLIIVTAVITQISFPIIIESQLERFRSNPDISSEQLTVIEQRLTEGVQQQRIITAISQVVGTPIVFLILTGIYFLVGSVFLGGDSTYKKLLSVFCWSSCISILAAIVKFPLVMSKGAINITLSPALLMSPDSQGTSLYRLLSNFDFFTIWQTIVFAVGFGIIYKFSKAKAFITIGIMWGIWIIISVVAGRYLTQFGL